MKGRYKLGDLGVGERIILKGILKKRCVKMCTGFLAICVYNEYIMGVAYSTHGEMRNTYKILVRKHEGKIQVGRPRRR
jgi:hypothetical protein